MQRPHPAQHPMPSAKSLVQSMQSNLLVCPITQEYFNQPVTTNCGHSFEKNALQAHFNKSRKNDCPTCNQPTQFSAVVVIIKELVLHHLTTHPELAPEYYLDKTLLAEMLAKENEPCFIHAALSGHAELITAAIQNYLDRMQKNLAIKSSMKVIKDAESIAALKPNAKAHYLCALAYLQSKNKPAATSEFEKALALAPQDLEAKLQLALLQAKTTPVETMQTLATALADCAPDAGHFRYSLARLQFKLGLMEEAIKSCQATLSMDSKNVPARFLCARAEQKQNNLAGAIEIYLSILDELTKNKEETIVNLSKVHYYLGKAYLGQGKKNVAANHFNKALQFHPNNALHYKILKELGLLYYLAKKYQKAAECFLKATQIKPSRVAYLYIGLCYFSLNKPFDALEELQKAISSAGNLRPARLLHARLTVAETYLAITNWEKAEAAATELLAHHPDNKKGFYFRCVARMNLNNLDAARLDAEKAGELMTQQERASMEMQLNNYAKALEILDKAIASNPSDAALFLARAQAKYYLSYQNAQDDLDQYCKLTPEQKRTPRYYNLRAGVNFKSGLQTIAIDDCNRAISLCKENRAELISALSLRYLIHLMRDQIEEAKLDCDEILKINPDSAEFHLKRVCMLIRKGNLAKARQELKTAAKNPDHFPNANLHLAMLYYLNGHYTEALQFLDQHKREDSVVFFVRIQALIGMKRLDDALALLNNQPKQESTFILTDLCYLQIHTLQKKEVDVLSHYPENAPPRHFLTAMRHVFMNDPAGAQRHFAAAIETNPAGAKYYLAYINNCIALRQLEKADRLFSSLFLNNHLTDYESIEFHTLKRKYQEAKNQQQAELEAQAAKTSAYRNALTLGRETLMNATNIHTYGKDLSIAIIHLNTALKRKEQCEAFFLRGLAFRLSGHLAHALDDMKKAQALEPNNIGIKLELAIIQALRGDYPTAESLMKELDNQDADYFFYLAQIDFVQARYLSAFEGINKAISLNPTPTMLLMRTHIYLKLNRYETANVEFTAIENKNISYLVTSNKISVINQLRKFNEAHQLYLTARSLERGQALATIMVAASCCPQHIDALLLKCKLLRYTSDRKELKDTLEQLKKLPLSAKQLPKFEKYKQHLTTTVTSISIFQDVSVPINLNDIPKKNQRF